MNKIVRTVCYFSKNFSGSDLIKLDDICSKLESIGYVIQTKRVCSPTKIEYLNSKVSDKSILLSVGTLSKSKAYEQFEDFKNNNVSFNIDLTKKVSSLDVDFLFKIIKECPNKTFNFTYVFNNINSSPYFPSANYEKKGFSIGLQPTNLSKNAKNLNEWLINMKKSWNEIYKLFKKDEEFLGIDSSIAPLFTQEGSLVNFIKKLKYTFNESVITSIYTTITNYIKKENPKPIGLCGLMFPCLEDFELAEEYEKGNFTIERNIYLSLHSGLGIDTYPIGIDEKPDKVLNLLKLIKDLSNKYKKPLSIRFVSDGKAKIGQKTNFQNQYLKDVIIKEI